MNLQQSDFLLATLASQSRGLMQLLGDCETRWSRRKLAGISLEKPIFLTGLARAGTTILLEQLTRLPGIASHRYRDFPFLFTPLWWNRFVNRFGGTPTPVERPHKDRIQITRDSPEAFEELLWQHFYPHVHDPRAVHRLRADAVQPEFLRFFSDHLRKILWLRSGRRYLSKENYNVARLELLGAMFPDCRFVVPVRHPVEHVQSLVRQHALFCEYNRLDSRVGRYLTLAGHYEFGPQRCPIRLDSDSGDRIGEEWRRGNEYRGYAIQWNAIYRLIGELKSRRDTLANQILVIRYEDFCRQPAAEMGRIVAHIDLPEVQITPEQLGHIAPPAAGSAGVPPDIRRQIWEETVDVAESWGYHRES